MRVTLRQWRQMRSWWGMLQSQLVSRLRNGRRWNNPRTWFLRSHRSSARTPAPTRQAVFETFEERRYFAIDPLISGPSVIQLGEPYVLTLESQGDPAARWEVDWGDGTEVQHVNVTAGQSSLTITHAFEVSQNKYQISAHAYDENNVGFLASSVAQVGVASESNLSWTSSAANSRGDSTTVLADGSLILLQVRNNQLTLYKINPAGELDTSFGNAGSTVLDQNGLDENYQPRLLADSAGKLYVAWRNNSNSCVARFLSDGTLDTNYGANGYLYSGAMLAKQPLALDATDRLLVTGNSGTIPQISRYLSNGQLDPTFGSAGSLTIYSTATAVDLEAGLDGAVRILGTANGNLLIWKYARNSNNILELSSPITLDLGGTETAVEMRLLTEGGVLVAGKSLSGNQPSIFVVKYRADGTKDPNFGSNGILTKAIATTDANLLVGNLRVLTSGQVVLSGSYRAADNVLHQGFWSIDPRGQWDTALNSAAWSNWNEALPAGSQVRDLQITPTGDVLWTGSAVDGSVTTSFVQRSSPALQADPLLVYVHRDPVTVSLELPDQVYWGYEFSAQLSSLNTLPGEVAQWEITWAPGVVETVAGSSTFVKHRYPVTSLNPYSQWLSVSAVAVLTDGQRISAPEQSVLLLSYIRPTVSVSGPTQAVAGDIYTLSLNIDRPTPVSPVLRWEINWGDGSEPQSISGNPSAATHVFARGGETYLVRATAFDAEGSYSTTWLIGAPLQADANFAQDGHDIQISLGANAKAQALTRTALGELLAAGVADGHLLLLKYHSTGELTQAFGTAGVADLELPTTWSATQVLQAKELASGEIQVFGKTIIAGATRYFTIRSNQFGVPVSDYGSNGILLLDNTTLHGPAEQLADGSLLALGLAANGETILWAYNDAGQLDTVRFALGQVNLGWVTTATPGATVPQALLVDDQGRIIIAVSQSANLRLARLLSTGAFDLTFSGDGRDSYALAGLSTGERQIVMGFQPGTGNLILGLSYSSNGIRVISYNAAGVRSTTWGTNGITNAWLGFSNVKLTGLQFNAEGSVYLGVQAGTAADKSMMLLISNNGYYQYGTELTIGSGTVGQFAAFLVNSDNSTFYIAGRGKNLDGVAGFAVSRFLGLNAQQSNILAIHPIYPNPDGLSWQDLHAQANDTLLGKALRIVTQPDGKLLVFGKRFDQQVFVTRMNNLAEIDYSFGSMGTILLGFDELVDAELTPAGRLVVVGKDYEWGYLGTAYEGYYSWGGGYGYGGYGYGEYDLGYGYLPGTETLVVDWITPEGYLEATSGQQSFQLLSQSTAVLTDGSVILAVTDGNGQPNLIKYILDPEQSGYLVLDSTFSVNGHANLQSFINGYYGSVPLGSVALQKVGQTDFLVSLSAGNKLYLFKFHDNGSIDEFFAGAQPLTISHLVQIETAKFLLEPNGQITIAVHDSLHSLGPTPYLVVIRYNADGSRDAAFNGPSGYRWTETGSWAPLIGMLRDVQGTIQFVFNNGTYVTFNAELTFVNYRFSSPTSNWFSDEALSLSTDGNFLIPTSGDIGYYDNWVDDGYGYVFVPRPDWDPGYGGSYNGYGSGYGYGNGYGNGYGSGYVPGYGFGYFEWQQVSYTETVWLQGPVIEVTRGPLSGHRVTVEDRPLALAATVPSTLVLGHEYSLDLTLTDYRGERVTVDNWTVGINQADQSYPGNTSAVTFQITEMPVNSTAYEIQLQATIQGRVYSWNFAGTLLENHAPLIAAIDPLAIAQGRTLTLPISASDEDPGDKLTYQLDGSAPAGAAINAQTGQLIWHLGAEVVPGTYDLQVLVSDRASTPLTTSQTISVTVLETTGTIASRNTVPVIAVLDLFEDTGDPNDFQTRNATLNIEFNDDLTPFENSEYLVELDWNLDGNADGSIAVASELAPQLVDWSEIYPGLSYGFNTVGVRVRETLPDRALIEGRETLGEWKWLSFRYEAPAPEIFAIGNIALAEPLADQENSTNKPILTGQVLAAAGISVSVEYDLNNDGAADGTVYSDPVTGVFTIDLTQQVYRSGQVPLAVRVARYDFATAGTVAGAWQSAEFTFVAPTFNSGITGTIGLDSPQTTGAGSTVAGDPGIVPMDISEMIPNWNIALLQNMGLYSRSAPSIPEYGDRFLIPLSSEVIVNQNGLDDWTETYSYNWLYDTYSITRERDAIDYLQVDNIDNYMMGFGYGYGTRSINYTQQYELQYELYSYSTGELLYSELRNIIETSSFEGYYSEGYSNYTHTVNRTEDYTYSPDIFVSVVGQTLLPGSRTRSGTQSYTASSDGTRTWNWNTSEVQQLESTTYAAQGTTSYWDSTYSDSSSNEGYYYSNEYKNGNYQFAFALERDRAETFTLADVSQFNTISGTLVSSSDDTVYVADVTQTESYSNNNYQYLPFYQSSPGFNRSAGSYNTLSTNGTQTHQYTMVGQEHIATDQPAIATLAYSGQRIMVDQLNQQTSHWDHVTSESDSNVTFSSQLNESYNSKTDRTLHSLGHKLLTFTDFVRDDYVEHEHQSLTTTTNWTSAAKSEHRGTDKSQAGIQSFYLANSQSDDNGSQMVYATADRDIRLNDSANSDYGKQHSQEQRSSQSKWSNSSQSGNDAQSYTEPGIQARSKSRADESNTGSGNTTSQSSFQTESAFGKQTTSRGTSSYTINSQGSTKGSSESESSLRGEREPYPGLVELIDNSEHSEETYRSQYQNQIQGRGSYHDSDEILNERTDSRESGNSSGSSGAIQKFQSDNNASENYNAQRQDESEQSSQFTAKFQREYLADLTTSRLGGAELLTGTESIKTKDERKETYEQHSTSDNHQIERQAVRDYQKIDYIVDTTENSSSEKSGKTKSLETTERQTEYSAVGTSYSQLEDSNYEDNYEFSSTLHTESKIDDTSILNVTTKSNATFDRTNSNGQGTATIVTHAEESRTPGTELIYSSWREDKTNETNDTDTKTHRDSESATDQDQSVTVPSTWNGTRVFSESSKYDEETQGNTIFDRYNKETSANAGNTSKFEETTEILSDVTWKQEQSSSQTLKDYEYTTEWIFEQEDTLSSNSNSNGQETRQSNSLDATERFLDGTWTEKRVDHTQTKDGSREAQSDSTSEYYRWEWSGDQKTKINQTKIVGSDDSQSTYSGDDYDSYERFQDETSTSKTSSTLDNEGTGNSDYSTTRRVVTLDRSQDEYGKRFATNTLDMTNFDKGMFTTKRHESWEVLDGSKESERTFTREENGTFTRTEHEKTDGAEETPDPEATPEAKEISAWAKVHKYDAGTNTVIYTEFKESRDSAVNDGTYTLQINENSWSKRDNSSMSSSSSERTEDSPTVTRSSITDSKTQSKTYETQEIFQQNLNTGFDRLEKIEVPENEDSLRSKLGAMPIASYAEISHTESSLSGGKLTTTTSNSDYSSSSAAEPTFSINVVSSSDSFDEEGTVSSSSAREYVALSISDEYDPETYERRKKTSSSSYGKDSENQGHLSKNYISNAEVSTTIDGNNGAWSQKIENSSTHDGNNSWTTDTKTKTYSWTNEVGKTPIEFGLPDDKVDREYSTTTTSANNTAQDFGTGTYKSSTNWTTTNSIKLGSDTSESTGAGNFVRTTHAEQKVVETSRPIEDKIGGEGRRSSTTESKTDTTDNGTYTSSGNTSSSLSAQGVHDDNSSSTRTDNGQRTEDTITETKDGTINYRDKYEKSEQAEDETSSATFSSKNKTNDKTDNYTLTIVRNQANGEKLNETEDTLVSYNTGTETADYEGNGITTYDKTDSSNFDYYVKIQQGYVQSTQQNNTSSLTKNNGEISYQDTSHREENLVSGETTSTRNSTGTGTGYKYELTKGSTYVESKHRTFPVSYTFLGSLYDLANFAVDVMDGKIDRDEYEVSHKESSSSKLEEGNVGITFNLTENEANNSTTKTGTVQHVTDYNNTLTQTSGSGKSNLVTTKQDNFYWMRNELTKTDIGNSSSRTATEFTNGKKTETKTYSASNAEPTTKTSDAEGKAVTESSRTNEDHTRTELNALSFDGNTETYSLETMSESVTITQKSTSKLDNESSKLVNTTTTTTDKNYLATSVFNETHDDPYGYGYGYFEQWNSEETKHDVEIDTFESKGNIGSEFLDGAISVLQQITDPFNLIQDFPSISNYQYQRSINRNKTTVYDENYSRDNAGDPIKYENLGTGSSIEVIIHTNNSSERTESRDWDEFVVVEAKLNESTTRDIRDTSLSDPEHNTEHSEEIHTLDSKVNLFGSNYTIERYSEFVSSLGITSSYYERVNDTPIVHYEEIYTSITGEYADDVVTYRDQDGELTEYSSTAFSQEFSLSLADHLWESTRDTADNFAQWASETFRSYTTAAGWANPVADLEFELKTFEEKLQWYIDAGIGVVDNLLESLNPLSSIFEIPDIGTQFGNHDAYAKGATLGNVLGFGLSIFSGFSVLGKFVGCGSQLQTLAKLYNRAEQFNTAVAFGDAVGNFASGNGSFGDVLTVAQAGLGPSIAAFGKMRGWSGCFVAGTHSLRPMTPEELAALAPLTTDIPTGTFLNTTVILAMAGVPLVMVANRRMAFGGPALPLKRLTKHVRRFFGQWERFEPELARVEDDLPWVEVPRAERAPPTLAPRQVAASIEKCVEEPIVNELRSTESPPLSTLVVPAPTIKEPMKPNPRTAALLDRPGFWRTCVAVWAVLLLLFAGGYFLTGATGESTVQAAASNTVAPLLGYWTDPATGQKVPYTSQAIETLQVGQRVLADDPDAQVSSTTQVDPKTWKKVRLSAVAIWQDGTRDEFDIETLQPPEWLAAHEARVGAMVPLPLDLGDLDEEEGLLGRVIAIEPFPDIQSGPGRVILTTVSHLNAAIHELKIKNQAGQEATVVTTRFHKFYKPATKEWVSAETLTPADTVGGAHADLTILANTQLPGTQRVYNMTVEGEHVYYVSELGLLAHNTRCNIAQNHATGVAGEAASGVTKNTQRIESISGTRAYRVPDGLDHANKTIIETKNVRYLEFRSQLRDSLYYSLEKGYEFKLIVRKNTKLAPDLQEAVDAGFITLKRDLQ